jgi:Mce-associated membrane protein
MAVDAGAPGHSVSDAETATPEPDEGLGVEPESKRPLRIPALAGMLIVVALAALVAYLGVRDYQSQKLSDQRNLLVQVARQGAVNLTTIDFEHADADIQRILGSATGQFYDDFAQRSKPFVDVVERVQSKSVGTVTEAGVESFSGNEAQVLVSVAVMTTNPGAPEQSPRNWRMRMSVQKAGDGAKISNVEFVP